MDAYVKPLENVYWKQISKLVYCYIMHFIVFINVNARKCTDTSFYTKEILKVSKINNFVYLHWYIGIVNQKETNPYKILIPIFCVQNKKRCILFSSSSFAELDLIIIFSYTCQ